MARGSNLAGGEFKIDRPHLDCKWRRHLLYQSSDEAHCSASMRRSRCSDCSHCDEEQNLTPDVSVPVSMMMPLSINGKWRHLAHSLYKTLKMGGESVE